MNICLDCGGLFDEPEAYYGEKLECYGASCREKWLGCPKCGGAYRETFKCDVCGEYITDKYIETENGEKICDNCYVERDICETAHL